VLFGILLAGLVEADALHAPLSDNAPATPNAATAPFRRLPPFLEVRLSPDIGFSHQSLTQRQWPSLRFGSKTRNPRTGEHLTTVNANAITSQSQLASGSLLEKRADSRCHGLLGGSGESAKRTSERAREIRLPTEAG
jgi:hypothetical protein